MDASAFEYFHAVARSGSVARAAIELGMEPSTLARHVGRLEAEVGARLFHRSGRGMVLTEVGTQLLAEATKVVESVEHSRRVAQQLAAGGPARISLTAQPTIAQTCFGPIGNALRQRFPRARVRFEEAYGHEIVAGLHDGSVDLALLYVPSAGPFSDYEALLQERLHCVLPGSWAPPAHAIDTASVLDLPLILPSTAHGLRGLVTQWAARHGKPLDVPVECDGSIAMTRRLVECGLGCTVLPLATIQGDVAAGRLRSVPIEGQDAVRTVALAAARNRAPLPGLWEVMKIARSEIARLVEAGHWAGVDRMMG